MKQLWDKNVISSWILSFGQIVAPVLHIWKPFVDFFFFSFFSFGKNPLRSPSTLPLFYTCKNGYGWTKGEDRRMGCYTFPCWIFCFSGGHRILPKRIFCNELKLRKFEGREHQLNGYFVLLFLALIIKIKFCTFS